VYREIKIIKQIHTTHNIKIKCLKYVIFLCIGSVGGVARFIWRRERVLTLTPPPQKKIINLEDYKYLIIFYF